jgi:hypothetical protein
LSIDQPQMLNFYFNYEVPRFGFAQSGWKRAVFAGWTTDGIFHYQSGFPMQTPGSTSTLTSVTFANGVWANRVAGQPLTPAPRSFSTPPRGQTRPPGPTPLPSHTTGISVARDIPANSWALARTSSSRRA